MDEEQFEELTKAVDHLARATRAISHGDKSGPTGLEMLSMAIAGNGLQDPLSEAVSDGLKGIADAIREGLDGIAGAIRGKSSPLA